MIFSRMPSSKMNSFTSNYDQNDHGPMLNISSNTFHKRKRFVSVNGKMVNGSPLPILERWKASA